jgi:hypothetical protein
MRIVSLAVRRRPHPFSVGRNGPSPPPRPPSSRPPPSWPAQTTTSCRTAEPRGGQPAPRFGGVRKGRKFTPRDCGRVERASKFGPCDGAGVQVRGAKRDGGARRRRAPRREECKTDMRSPPQAATLHEGVRHMITKAETHEGPRRCTGRRNGALCMWFVSHVTLPPGASSRLDARRICLAAAVACDARAMQATDGGVGKCAPCRRGSSPAPASAKTMADWTDRRAGGGERMRHKERRLWGH